MNDRPAPGSRLSFRWRKWDGTSHWEHEAIYLGADEHGDWIGQGRGWRTERPGVSLADYGPVVMLIPSVGDHVVSLFPPGSTGDTAVYVDLAWDVAWASADEITGIDMDLDVVKLRDDALPRVAGRQLWIDDEDEWDEHRIAFGYPDDVVAILPRRAAEILARVGEGTAPFDAATGERWSAVLDAWLDAPDDGSGA